MKRPVIVLAVAFALLGGAALSAALAAPVDPTGDKPTYVVTVSGMK